MYCKNCVENLEPGHSFCKKCGAPIANAHSAISAHLSTGNHVDFIRWVKAYKKHLIIGSLIIFGLIIVIVWLNGTQIIPYDQMNPGALTGPDALSALRTSTAAQTDAPGTIIPFSQITPGEFIPNGSSSGSQQNQQGILFIGNKFMASFLLIGLFCLLAVIGFFVTDRPFKFAIGGMIFLIAISFVSWVVIVIWIMAAPCSVPFSDNSSTYCQTHGTQ